jgi:hypothetical protein
VVTHDELLIEINRRLDVALYNGDAQSIHALRAVVELHKPESRRMPFCVECRGVWQGEIDVVLYPCPTIKAIEKELG